MDPDITIVVVPRERFSCTKQSLKSILIHTEIPYKLIYVDGGSPQSVKRYLKKKAAKYGFTLIRRDHYLTPTEARNIGLQQVDTKYLVFCDNDVVVSSGWLKAMRSCAVETGAAVVSPLTCQYEPLHKVIHCTGGVADIKKDTIDGKDGFVMVDKIANQGKRVWKLRNELIREQTHMAEFHCVLIRRDIFDKIGALDENILNTKEHIDFTYRVKQAGEKIYFEPDSLLTYVPGPPLKFSDLHFYMLRWSNHWERSSLLYLKEKYQLLEDNYLKKRLGKIGWRRERTIIQPIVNKFPTFMRSSLQVFLQFIDLHLNTYLTRRYHRQKSRRAA